MGKIRTSIIPDKQQFVGTCDSLDLRNIAFFCALGFFLDNNSFYNGLKCLRPGTESIVENNEIIQEKPWFSWNYNPREISFKQAVEEYAHLFEKITKEALNNKEVILPLSGGLDSRSQAACLSGYTNVKAYSYQFANSFNETKYGSAIARIQGWDFQSYIIPQGYLWENIENLASINGCYSEFTHPRQMAIYNQYSQMGEIFYLGHWGDVLFDSAGVNSDSSFDELLSVLKKKVVKKGGMELGRALWQTWGLSGNFDDELSYELANLLDKIKIKNANSRLRAFKSMYWAPRWTSVNLSIFQNVADVFLPYYHDEMCQFICSIPEEYLDKRKIQIEYIKKKSLNLARVPWQSYDPYNLLNYMDFYTYKNYPRRLFRKINRSFNNLIYKDNEVIRNWENQFLGKENNMQLEKWLYENKNFSSFVPKSVVDQFYMKFSSVDSVYFSHSVSMLLTLSLFTSKINSIHNV